MLLPDRRPQRAIRILHLEDSDVDAEFVRRRLDQSDLRFQLLRAINEISFREQLSAGDIEIILSDYEVPGFDGLAALALAQKTCPQVPFIFVSGAMGEELAVETLKSGATDYVLKDRLSRLAPAIDRALDDCHLRAERRRAEERATLLLEGMADGFVLLDSSLRVTYVNLALEKLFNRPRLEILDRGLAVVFPESTLEEIFRNLEPVRSARCSVEFELEVPSWDRSFAFKASPVDGGVCLQVRDITAARDSARDLATARERFQFVRRSSGVGFWYCDLPFDVLEWDETVKAHFHLPPDAVVTIDTFFERIHPDDRARTRLAIETSIAVRTPYRIDYRTLAEDGTATKWIRAIGRATHNAAGDAIRFDGITIDLTDRVAVEEQVREQASELEAINRVGAAMAAELDLSRLVQTIIDATTELTGAEVGAFFYNTVGDRGDEYSLSCVSSKPPGAFSRFPMPRVTELFRPTFLGESIVRLEDVTRDARYGRNSPFRGMPAGHYPVRSYLAVPVISRSGAVLGGLFFGHHEAGVFQERSERLVQAIAAQAAIAIDNAHLFDEVRRANAEKDRSLDNERAARAEVEHASRMKDEFLATLSHELRTPLNAILGWSQVLQLTSDQLPDEMQEGVKIIERNARAQTQIIDDLLDMNRIISGRIRLDIQRVEIAPVIRAAMETVQPAAIAREIRLQPVIDPQAGPVSADPSRLQQVFWNLLMNAVKFTPKGGKVQVVVERVNSHIEVHVVDTGEGIDPEFLPHVFDRFKQADASTTRRHGGLGLGLAIVKQLVELHGGSVSARSPGRGCGSTFTVSLPLTVIHSDSEPLATIRRHPRTGAVAAAPETLIDFGGLSILVVDDEPDARGLLKRLLEKCGAQVRTAASVAEAMSIVLKEPPALLISDIGMPFEDGYSLIRQLRQLPAEQGGRIPAIALTAFARAEDRVNAIVSGFQHHLAKPVEPAELLAVIASLAGPQPEGR